MKTYRNFEWLKDNSFNDVRHLVLCVCSIWNIKNKYTR